jgi:hypothetical protein
MRHELALRYGISISSTLSEIISYHLPGVYCPYFVIPVRPMPKLIVNFQHDPHQVRWVPAAEERFGTERFK